MTTRTELQDIIRNGENSVVEFKRDELTPVQLAKELVALSNFQGGMVLLGVEDNGTVSGINRPDLEEWVMNVCRDSIRPAINPYFETVKEIETGVDIAIISVPIGADVHTVWHHNMNRYYIRTGSQSREPSPQELSRLFQRLEMLRDELRPVSMATFSDLDYRRLVDYFRRVREQDIPDKDDINGWQALLINTELMSGNRPTVSGMLLFGNTPKKFLPYSGISATAFPGREKDYATIERASLRGPMTPLRDVNKALVESGLVEQATEFVRRNTRVQAHLEDGLRRVEKPAYPHDAIREAIVNSLIHRDYLLQHTDIELSIFDNRIETISPGNLPNGISIEGIRVGARSARNEILKDIMRDYGYLEHLGMGIPRKIIRGMRQHNGTDPILSVSNERFTVGLLLHS